MRIWHKWLLPVLPNQWIVAQWREVCGIARDIDMIGTPNHILVNKVMDYPLSHLYTFANLVIDEMHNRGFAVTTTSFNNFQKHIFNAMEKDDNPKLIIPDDVRFEMLFYNWHTERYFWQCISNLEEKYDCGGITDDEWDLIEDLARLYAHPDD